MDQELKQYLDTKFAEVATKENLAATQESIEELKGTVQRVESDLREVKTTVEAINKRDLEDSNALAKIAVKHDERITKVEKDVKELKLHHAS